jgi:hypothetical protein
MVAALRDVGRPVDANKLLAAVGASTTMRTVVSLLDRCGEPDRKRVLSAVVEREAQDVAELLSRLGPGHALAASLTDIIAFDPDRVRLLPLVIGELDPKWKEQLLAKAVATRSGQEIADLVVGLPDDEASFVVFRAVLEGNPTLDAVLSALRSLQVGLEPFDPALHHLLDQPVSRLGQLLDGLRGAGFDDYADAILHDVANPERGDQAIAMQVASLYATGQPDPAAQLLAATLTGRNNRDLKEFIQVLRSHPQTDALAGVAAWVRATYATIGDSNVNDLLRQLGLREFADRRWGRK